MDRRDAARAEHRRYVVENDERIVFVGACVDDGDNQCASFYVFDADSEQQVRDWLSQEPFVRGDVYGELIVRRFLMGVNRLDVQDWPARTAAQ
jgi:uncharacterized protein YciI